MEGLALSLIEGTKEVRDKYINKTEVLDKVKKLTMLPDGEYIETREMAIYYEVDINTIRQIRNRHREELDSDGVITLSGEDFSKYRKDLALQGVTLLARSNITLFTRRAALRLGMLLTTSPVAVKIRDYLLTMEEQAQPETKLTYINGWNNELDQYALGRITDIIAEGKNLFRAFETVAEELDTNINIISTRWYRKLKEAHEAKNTPEEELPIEETEPIEIIPEDITDSNIETFPLVNVNLSSLEVKISSITDILYNKIDELTKKEVDWAVKCNSLEHELSKKDLIIQQLQERLSKIDELIAGRDKTIAEANLRYEELQKKYKRLKLSFQTLEEEGVFKTERFRAAMNGDLEKI